MNLKNEAVFWIKEYFDKTATKTQKAVIGISGGKDSSVVASLVAQHSAKTE